MRRTLELALILSVCVALAAGLVHVYPHPELYTGRVLLSVVLASAGLGWLLVGRLRILRAPAGQPEGIAAVLAVLAAFFGTLALCMSFNPPDGDPAAGWIASLWYTGLLACLSVVCVRGVALLIACPRGSAKTGGVRGAAPAYLLCFAITVPMVWMCSTEWPRRQWVDWHGKTEEQYALGAFYGAVMTYYADNETMAPSMEPLIEAAKEPPDACLSAEDETLWRQSYYYRSVRFNEPGDVLLVMPAPRGTWLLYADWKREFIPYGGPPTPPPGERYP